jgi:cobalt-zinc-cadmium efflux system protein
MLSLKVTDFGVEMDHHHHHNATKNIKLAFFLNLSFTIIEFIGGLLTNSTAILADAVHDLGDSIALAQAWYFEKLTERDSNNRYTYGFRRFSLLGALISTLVLLLSSFYILSEAVPRILQPEPAHAEGMVLLAVIGVLVNGYGMLRLVKEHSLNAKAVGLHLLEDVLGWLAILVMSIILLFFDLYILDPILSVLITIYILYGLLKNLRAIVPIFLQAAPEQFNIDEIKQRIIELDCVTNVHSLQVWSLDDQHQVFSAHLVADRVLNGEQYSQLKQQVRDLVEQYGFYHSTVEIELPGEACRQIE